MKQDLSLKCSAWKGFVLVPIPSIGRSEFVSQIQMFQTPPVPRDRVSGYLGWGGGGLFLSLKEAYIPVVTMT